MIVETNRADYNIFPYKHLGAKDVVIQQPLTLRVRIKTGMGTAKTPCYKSSIFSAETAKSQIGVCNKLFHTSSLSIITGHKAYFEFWINPFFRI
jgi:hypothetical protein